MKPKGRSLTPCAVLVLDGDQRAAVAVSRSLGRAGCTVVVGAPDTTSIAGGSRLVAGEVALPDPQAGGEAYARAVVAAAVRAGAEVILPVTEASALALLEHPGLLHGHLVPLPNLERFKRACDKPVVLACAAELGIDVPSQHTVGGPDDQPPPFDTISYPVVVKPARSLSGPEGARFKTAVIHARDAAELARAISEIPPAAYPLLIQERIMGPGIGVFLLRWNDRIHAVFAHRRLREKPPSGGVSTCCESISVAPTVLQRSADLLEALEFQGVAMVEFKHCARTGRDFLMEVNPRFWGSLQLAIDAGVDFPQILLQLLLGRAVEPVTAWRLGIRSRWLLGDVDHLLSRLRYTPAELHLPPDAPGKLRTAAAVLMPWRPGQRNDVFRLSDPVPGLREAARWLKDLW